MNFEFVPSRKAWLSPTTCHGDLFIRARTPQIVGSEPQEATFASSVIRQSCSVAPWLGQLRRYAAEAPHVKKQILLTAAVVFLAVVCTAGAAWTVYWSLRYGLAPRAPLSPLQTVVRFAMVTFAAILLPLRRDSIERTTLLCAVVAAGSSALFGLGFRSTGL